MNVYVVLEGEAEQTIYRMWMPFLNPALKEVKSFTELSDNNYYLLSGGGQPQIYDIIERAIGDIRNHPAFSRFVVVLDSEECDYSTVYDEVARVIADAGCPVEHKIVIQHFCLETWGLANKKMVKRNPADTTLQKYQRLFDVSALDPEDLPPLPDEELNRAQFAFSYLRRLFREKNPNLIYSKRRPDELGKQYYFEKIRERCVRNHHIVRFQAVLDAFV